MLNVGIIGPGRVAEWRAEALKEIQGAQLWSVAGRDLASAQVFAAKHNAVAEVNAYDNLPDMLNDANLHAVIIATPDILHAEQILLAARAGKAIFVEKPVCTSLAEGQKILAAIQQTPVVLAVGYHLRWHQGFRKLAKLVHDNELGKIKQLKLQWGVNYRELAKWRVDPERGKWFCLSVLGTHLIDITRWLMVPMCGEVVRLTSTVNRHCPQAKIDEEVSVLMRFQSGAIAEITCSVLVDCPLTLGLTAEKSYAHGTDLVGRPENRRILIGENALYFEKINTYSTQLADFIETVLYHRTPEVTLDEGLKNVAHLVAIWN